MLYYFPVKLIRKVLGFEINSQTNFYFLINYAKTIFETYCAKDTFVIIRKIMSLFI